MFDVILTSAHVYDSWAIGKIVPIFKNKGNNTDPSNYRSITQLGCLEKAFTTIVSNRFTSVIDIQYNQAGFREDHSIIDHIFLLKKLADLYINNNNIWYRIYYVSKYKIVCGIRRKVAWFLCEKYWCTTGWKCATLALFYFCRRFRKLS